MIPRHAETPRSDAAGSPDPFGPKRLDRDRQEYVRVIPDPEVPRLHLLLASSAVQDLQHRGLLVRFSAEHRPSRHASGPGWVTVAPGGMPTVRTTRADPVTLHACAARWVTLNLALAQDGLALHDAHHQNFALDDDGRPVWIDEGSLVPLRTGLEGIIEFLDHHLLPLRLIVGAPRLDAASVRRPVSPAAYAEARGRSRALPYVALTLAAEVLNTLALVAGGAAVWVRPLRTAILRAIDRSLRRLGPTG